MDVTPYAEPQVALVSVGLMMLSVGLSILAGYILDKLLKTPLQDERPTPLATRGSYVAWLSGIRRLGYVLTWVGGRHTREEKGAGKGDSFDGPKQTVYVEDGMHVLCVGPVDGLLEIESGGKKLFEGPITSTSHPNGTLIDLGGEGSFRIFWGDDDQPVNTWLGDAARQGVLSRWPNYCYVEWRARRLGPSPVWPPMSYTLLKKPTGNHLSNTDPWILPTKALTGTTYTPIYAVNSSNKTITFDTPWGDITADVRPLDIVRLTGNALSDRDLTVVGLTVTPVTTGTPPYIYITGYRTSLIVEDDITGIDTAGSVQVYVEEQDDGANPAHAIADMLFEKWPQGLSLSKDDWDMDSLEDMGTDTLAEDLRTSWVAQDAASAQSRFGAGLQDLGYMVPIDTASGLVKFQPLREPVGALSNIDDDHVVDNLPELEKLFGERPVDFMIFGFPDRANNHRDMTVARMADGQVGFLEVARARNVPITVTTYYDTAATIANRRTQEEMAQNSIWTITTNRATREFLPGQAITADFTTEVLRVLEVEPVPDSNRVRLQISTDAYGIQAQAFSDDPPPEPAGGTTPVVQDITFAMVEVPEYIDDVPPQTVLIPRIRGHAQVDSAALHLSADDVTYTQLLTTTVHNPGGFLTTALTADGLFEPDDGEVQFTAYGPDIGNALDLTGDDTSWRGGRQVVILNSTAGTEYCFLKKVTVVSGTTYSLDGLIRARYGSKRLAHPTSAQVFLVDSLDVSPIQGFLLAPEVTRYAKTQPNGNGTVSLSVVSPTATLLYGQGVRPLPVAALRVTAPDLLPAYYTGNDVTIEWDYATPRTAGTSAGLQGAGNGVGTTAPEGNFQLEILTTLDVVVRTEPLTTNTYTYTNANLQSDLGGEVDFKVRVTQLRDGYSSSTETITVEKL